MSDLQDLMEEQADQELDESYTSTNLEVMEHNKSRFRMLNKAFAQREILDRLGYGLGAHQFINILFFLTGAGAFLVGIINAFRDIISDFLAAFIKEFSQLNTLGKRFISTAGILFGFSFLGILLGIQLSSTALFAISMLLGSIGVVAYGHLHVQLVDTHLKHEKRSRFLRSISHYGLLITLLAFILSGFLLETFKQGQSIELLGVVIPLTGYFLVFELAAIMFILSGFILAKTPLKAAEKKQYSLFTFFKSYLHESFSKAKQFFSSKYSTLLFLGSLFIGVIHTLGTTFYGYIIYDFYKTSYLGGFLNIALVFGIAIFVSLLSPWFTRFVQRRAGLAPMFVFGTLLMTMVPLALLYNPHFYAVILAVSLGVLGSSILGVAQGLLTNKLLEPSEKKTFFTSLKTLSAIPFLILVGGGAYVAHIGSFPFSTLLKIIILVLVGFITPLYFSLVISSQRKRL
ncbi:hypothetical protein K9M74_03375 [Candidatus Woesearchaeota archaeon]|nr:hypothetical protein [Candidatus Woesearchaeota archaeon]